MVCLSQFFFIKRPKYFPAFQFTIKAINDIHPWYCIFHFFNNKNFFWPVWSVTLCQNIFVLWYSYMMTNFKFRISIFVFKYSTYRSKYGLDLTSVALLLIVLWNMLLYLPTISSNLSICMFWYCTYIFIDFVLKSSNKSFSLSLFVE